MVRRFASELARLTIRYCVSYTAGIMLAAMIASFWGGSASSLILYSLATGAPFFVAALLLGLVFRRSVALHPISWAIAAPVVTALIWFPLVKVGGVLFNTDWLALYATFCACCCALVFFASTRLWPLREADLK